MAKHPKPSSQSYSSRLVRSLKNGYLHYWRGSRWHKTVVILIVLIVFVVTTMYGIAIWYIQSQRSQPLQQGVSFIPDYAQSLGVDPQETMDGLIGIGVKQFRLTSYWSDMEPSPGHYDFTQLDWEFQKAEAAHASIILTVGLRQPRWPECHSPSWVDTAKPASQWQPQLEQFMQAVINRYKDSPSLQSYQLENEYFLKGFGLCQNFDRQRLVDEYALVKKADPSRKIIVGRSNNALGLPLGQPQPDEFSVSVYKRVWDAAWTHRYFEYPWPAWFYGFMAGTQKIFLHKNMIIGELQAETWTPHGQSIQETSLAEQNKSLDAKRLKDRFEYGRDTGMRQIELWGGEYWYYRKVKLHDPSLWNVAKQEFNDPRNNAAHY